MAARSRPVSARDCPEESGEAGRHHAPILDPQLDDLRASVRRPPDRSQKRLGPSLEGGECRAEPAIESPTVPFAPVVRTTFLNQQLPRRSWNPRYPVRGSFAIATPLNLWSLPSGRLPGSVHSSTLIRETSAPLSVTAITGPCALIIMWFHSPAGFWAFLAGATRPKNAPESSSEDPVVSSSATSMPVFTGSPRSPTRRNTPELQPWPSL